MATALIVIGVIAFLAFDAYVLYRFFGSRRSADDYGAIRVPGDAELTLPAGKVKLSYQEAYKADADSSGDIDFGVPSQLEVTVVSASGEPLEIKGPGFRGTGESLDTGKGWSRAKIGTVQLDAPGIYTVAARGELVDPVEPQVLIGK